MEHTQQGQVLDAAHFVQNFMQMQRLVSEMEAMLSWFSETMERAPFDARGEQDVCMGLYLTKSALASAFGSLHLMESVLRSPAMSDEYRKYLLGVLSDFRLAATEFAYNLSADHRQKQAGPPRP